MKDADVQKLKNNEEANRRMAQEANLPYTDALFKVDYYLRLGNLMKGRENASIIDLKMGKSTVTCNIIDSQRMAKRLAKDKGSTSSSLGFKVIGYVIKSATKEAEERFYKFPQKKESDIPDIFRRILSYPAEHSEHFHETEQKINHDAQKFILNELYKLLDFLKNRSSRDIKGASLLILADHFS